MNGDVGARRRPGRLPGAWTVLPGHRYPPCPNHGCSPATPSAGRLQARQCGLIPGFRGGKIFVSKVPCVRISYFRDLPLRGRHEWVSGG